MSEIFPLEVRAKAIAVFFAIAQGFGALGPDIYGSLINSHRWLFIAYLIGGAVMLLGGVAELIFGVAAEQKSLEDIATPISAVKQPAESVAAGARSGFAHGVPPPYPPTKGAR